MKNAFSSSVCAIDLFAGLGGWSLGAERAGVRVIWAANHWLAACETYARNHPDRPRPECQDLQQADWGAVPRHDIGMASPACQGHCNARAIERPHHDSARSTAFAVVSCAEVHRQPVFLVENVTEFLAWILFPAWKAAMQALGYTLAIHQLDSADHGIPQHRVRSFIVATRSKHPLWLKLPRRPHVPAESIVDFDAGEWSPVSAMCENTRRRVRNGRREFGDRFYIAYYGTAKGGRPLYEPFGTFTTRDRFALVDGDRMRMLSVDECRAGMSFPAATKLPPSSKLAKHLLGNAVPPVQTEDILRAVLAAA